MSEVYTLIKLSDDKFKGAHPNGIGEGFTFKGTIFNEPIVGERFGITASFNSFLITSEVIELLEDNKFKTKNSTYQLIKEKDKN
jgi:hypothetical protein